MKTLLLVYTLTGVLKLSVPFNNIESCDRAANHMVKTQPGYIYSCEVTK